MVFKFRDPLAERQLAGTGHAVPLLPDGDFRRAAVGGGIVSHPRRQVE